MIVIENGDKIRGDASAATVVDYTLHGVVTTTLTQLADGQLAATIGDLYTASATVVVTTIILVNTDTVARTVNLYLTPSGGTARRLIPKDVSLSAGYSLHFDGAKVMIMSTTGEVVASSSPTAHATSHQTGGSDSIKLDDFATPDDNTDLNANTTNHGLVVKATAPAANVLNVVGIANGETAYTNKAMLDGTNPADLGVAAPGTSLIAAHRDHVHLDPVTAHVAAADPHTVYPLDTEVLKKDGSVALTADWLLGEQALQLDTALSADGKYSGIVEGGVAGTVLAFGDIAYLVAASTRWNLAVASSATTARGKMGVCVLAATAAANTTTMLLWGKVRADAKFPTLPVGDPIYLSAGTAGVITGTAVSGTTNYVVRIVGYGNSGDELFFKPDNTYLELA